MMICIAISFTVSNDELIALSLWPFPQILTIPKWLSVVLAFVFGGILGGGLMWGQMLTIRAELWKSQSQIQKLQAQALQQIQYGKEQSLVQSTTKKQ